MIRPILFLAAAILASPAARVLPTEKTREVSANGQTFTYVEEGAGPPVVLVHGSVSDYREWGKQLKPLGQQYRVVAYSRRYHWPNVPPGPAADASLELQADDLAALISALHLAPARIIGHSYGAATALHLTLRHPELVHSLVLAEPGVPGVLAGQPDQEAILKEAQMVRSEMTRAFATKDAAQIVRTITKHVAPGEYEKATPAERKGLLANVAAFELDYTARRPAFTCADAQKIAVPVLLVTGKRSPMGLQRMAETTAGCIKGAQLVSIPQATHWMQLDQAEVFNSAILAFLSKHQK